MRRGKTPPYEEKLYVDIKCPHCEDSFELARSALAYKAKACLEHLRECVAYEPTARRPPEKKRKYTNEDVLRAVTESESRLRRDMQTMEMRIISNVSTATRLGLPPPTTQDELYKKLEDREEEIARDRSLLRTISSNSNVADSASTCVVCLEDEVTDVLTLPCLHRVMCWRCWKTVEMVATASDLEPKCPACKQNAQKAVRVL